MSSNLKIPTIKCCVYSDFKKILNKLIFFSIFLTVFLTLGCSLFGASSKRLSEREIIFEKAKALMAAEQFALAEPFFLNLTAEPEEKNDLIYDMSLWNMGLIYEKLGFPEKSILAYNLLLDRQTEHVSLFKIHAALMKNYFYVDNQVVALKYKNKLDDVNPKLTMSADKLYQEIAPTLNLNYDQLILEELNYVGEIQKYLLFVMEQNKSSKNEQATEMLISLYQRSYALTKYEVLNKEFKDKILISLLDKLRLFHLYKLNDLNINMKTVAKFTRYAEELEKEITDRLHQ